jgi:hypothetical protein
LGQGIENANQQYAATRRDFKETCLEGIDVMRDGIHASINAIHDGINVLRDGINIGADVARESIDVLKQGIQGTLQITQKTASIGCSILSFTTAAYTCSTSKPPKKIELKFSEIE